MSGNMEDSYKNIHPIGIFFVGNRSMKIFIFYRAKFQAKADEQHLRIIHEQFSSTVRLMLILCACQTGTSPLTVLNI